MIRAQKVMEISVHDLCPNPNQPRKVFEPGALQALAASIRENGMLQPITVRKIGRGRFEIIAGERRYRAAMLANCQTVPCILTRAEPDQSAILALLENIQRQDLDCFEEAEAYRNLLETGGFTRTELAARLGKAPCTVANKLRLLQLTEEERELLRKGGLTERHARAALAVEDPNRRLALLKKAAAKKWTVAETERQAAARPAPRRILLIKDIRIFLNTIRSAVAAMNQAGIPADCETDRTDSRLVYTISIPLEETVPRAESFN